MSDLFQYTEPADYFGRKVTLVMSGVLVVVGGSIQSAAVQGAVWYACAYQYLTPVSFCLLCFRMLIVGRFIAGLGCG